MFRSKIIQITITLAVFACDFGRVHPPTNPSLGTLTAKMNGKDWTKTYKNAYQVVQCFTTGYSTVLPCSEDHLDITSELYTTEGFLRQQLLFMKIPQSVGKHSIVPAVWDHCNEKDPVYGRLFTATDDGCGAGDYYNVLAGEDNYIQVDKYDKETSEIKGRFQVTLLIEHRVSNESVLPDTLRFTDGRFHTKVLFNY